MPTCDHQDVPFPGEMGGNQLSSVYGRVEGDYQATGCDRTPEALLLEAR